MLSYELAVLARMLQMDEIKLRLLRFSFVGLVANICPGNRLVAYQRKSYREVWTLGSSVCLIMGPRSGRDSSLYRNTKPSSETDQSGFHQGSLLLPLCTLVALARLRQGKEALRLVAHR